VHNESSSCFALLFLSCALLPLISHNKRNELNLSAVVFHAWECLPTGRMCDFSNALLSLCVFALPLLLPLLLLCAVAVLPHCCYRVFHFKLKIIKSNKAVNRTFQFEFSRLRRKLYTCAALSLALLSLSRCKIPKREAARSYLKRISCHNWPSGSKDTVRNSSVIANSSPLATKCHF